jgi:hypothetical protein
MTDLPLMPRLKSYRGANPKKQRQTASMNSNAARIVDHLNRLIANDPSEVQMHAFEYIAIDLGVSVEDVRAAIPGGGYNGITLRVTPADREVLACYKKP